MYTRTYICLTKFTVSCQQPTKSVHCKRRRCRRRRPFDFTYNNSAFTFTISQWLAKNGKIQTTRNKIPTFHLSNVVMYGILENYFAMRIFLRHIEKSCHRQGGLSNNSPLHSFLCHSRALSSLSSSDSTRENQHNQRRKGKCTIQSSLSTISPYPFANERRVIDHKYRCLSSTADAIDSNSSTKSSLWSSSMERLLLEAGIERKYLEEMASKRPTPLRLKDMYNLGSSPEPHQRLLNAQFLYDELPIRIALRVMDLLTLPHGLGEAAPIQQVTSIYLNFLKRFQDLPRPTDAAQEEAFTDMLQAQVLDRTSIPVSIASGVQTWWKTIDGAADDEENRLHEMEDALNRFFTARVGLRFLTEHYVLSSNRPSAAALRDVTCLFPDSGPCKETGLIQANCNVVREVRRVADLVTAQTTDYYGADLCPVIDIVDCVGDDSPLFTYVPQHLHYMITELLKNSCRASIRRYRELVRMAEESDLSHAREIEIPRIRVVMVKGKEDVTIKIADKGGGIPRSLLPTIWKFAHSTANQDEQQTDFGTDASGAKIRGFGLPLARIYARYFGGELSLKSTEGYGLDAYLHLPRLGNACEQLPLRVRDSPGERDSMPLSPLPKHSKSKQESLANGQNVGIRTYSTTPRSGQNLKLTASNLLAPSRLSPSDPVSLATNGVTSMVSL